MERCYVTQERLKELFEYSDEEGTLVRILSVRGSFGVGSPCDKVCTTGSGYARVFIDGRGYYVHKLVFLYFNGYTPAQVDHINRVRNDNRIENLRACTQQTNSYNSSLRSDNTSGVKGVSWDKKNKKWCCYIDSGKKRISFGRFKSIELCELIVDEARELLHKDFGCAG